MLTKVHGIVIRCIKYRETSLIFDLYTAEYGLASFIVHGARKPKSRMPASLFQLMNWVELVTYFKDVRSLSRVKEAQLDFQYKQLPFDLHRRSIGIFMTEVVQKTIKEHESNPALFSSLKDAYKQLDSTPYPVANFHILFLLELSAFLGFRPGGQCSEDTPYFDMVSGRFVAHLHPVHTLDHTHSKLMSRCLQLNINHCHEISLTRKTRTTLLHHLLHFYQYHIEKMGEIKTHKILAEVL